MSTSPQEYNRNEEPLGSWKEIAAYLQRNPATVRRWEKEEGLPVHRHSHNIRSSVYAFPSEIEAWRAGRKLTVEPLPPVPMWRRCLTPSFAVTIVLSLIMVGNGVRPEAVLAQQGQTRTMLCSGPDCNSGEISPDGKFVLTRIDGAFTLRDLATKKLRTIVSVAGERVTIVGGLFSPDGSRIAYTRIPAGGTSRETAIVNTNGAGSRTVYRGGGPFAWSPDGKRLLIDRLAGETKRGLLWLDLASGAVQQLRGEYWNPTIMKVSPDGRYIAFNASNDKGAVENVFIMAADGSGETRVSASPAYQRPLAWTPNGKNMIFAQSDAAGVSLWSVPVADGKIQGPPINQRTEIEKGSAFIGFSRSGTLYYWVRARTTDVYTASLDPATGKATSAPVLLPVAGAGHTGMPRWSPDSRQLLYFRDDGDVREWHVYSTDTGKDQRLAMNVRNALGYCWSKDGASILFNSFADPARPEAARFNLADGQVTPLFPGSAPFELGSCSGDLVVGRTSNAMQIRNLIGGFQKDIYTPGIIPARLSPDQRSVAFASAASGTLHVVSSDGGPLKDLASAAAPAEFAGIAWSADSRFVYFARRPDSHSPFELFRVPAAGGAAEGMGLKIEDMTTLIISPDGTHIAFDAGGFIPEIWAVQGLLPAKK